MCNSTNPFYDADIIDGFALIIDPSAMVTDWREDSEDSVDKDKTDIVYLVAHEEFGKGAQKVSQHRKDLIGMSLKLPTKLNSKDAAPDRHAPLA